MIHMADWNGLGDEFFWDGQRLRFKVEDNVLLGFFIADVYSQTSEKFFFPLMVNLLQGFEGMTERCRIETCHVQEHSLMSACITLENVD
ncbi:UNVERIFIED_CONTAM: hypothetical protein PYX00_001969 [Menopon gallinae]|uniref:Uncharacterized protein n=1 Tax=Menopon gallinae TaxID=328185 RepID=A0AAW2IGA2_9NEOP